MDTATELQEHFRRPDFGRDLDPEPYLARLPADAYCKGMFFHDVLKLVERAGTPEARQILADVPRRRYLPFKDYPLREHMELTARIAPVLHPNVPTREGMRRLGWIAYPAFAESMVGRVVFGIFGDDLDLIFEHGPKSFGVSLTRGRAVATRLGTRHWRYEFTDFFGYLDSYYVGVMEGPIRHHGRTPDVGLDLRSLSDGIMDIRWD
jgi:uncharacterized protein (TIGR02265 family)